MGENANGPLRKANRQPKRTARGCWRGSVESGHVDHDELVVVGACGVAARVREVVVAADHDAVVPDGVDVVVDVVVDGVGVAQSGRVIVLLSRVTAPVLARRRPAMVAPVLAVIEVWARTVPIRTELVPSVAELPTLK